MAHKKNPGKPIRSLPAIVKDKNSCLRLEMQRDHPTLVQHSQFHTQGWRANGDISIIVSQSNPENPSIRDIMATERYISGYACKGNMPTGALHDLFKDLVQSTDTNSSATAKSLCTKLLMNTVKRDISAVEASYELSGLPLFNCSHYFQNVSLTGSRILERTGSTATKSTILDKYIARAHTDKSSWYQFICKMGKVPVIAANTQATWPLNKEYCRTMLLLHWPNWRSIEDITGDNPDWISQFTKFLDTDICPNFVKANIENARQNVTSQIIQDTNNDTSDKSNDYNPEQPDWMELIQPNAVYDDFTSEFDFFDGGPDHIWSITSLPYPDVNPQEWLTDATQTAERQKNTTLLIPNADCTKLNEKQQLAFNLVMQTIFNYVDIPHSADPLRLVVAGAAGSGKSYLIQCLVKSIRQIYKQNDVVQVICPTGNSANLISGVTLHRFLKIPIGSNSNKEMTPPMGTNAHELQKNCDGLLCLIVDERSLVGSKTLGWMEFHCRYGANKGKNYMEQWGGIPVIIFLGDDIQLPPVCDSPVYCCKSKVPAAMHGALVWQDFKNAVELTTVVRQNTNQTQLKDTLQAARNYSITQNQVKWLQEFQWNNLHTKYGQPLLNRMLSNGLHVFPNHDQEWQFNKAQLLELNSQINPIAKIEAAMNGPHANSASSDKSGGLIRTLYLSKNARVMLTVNLNVDFGLFNGAVGTVRDIVYPAGKSPLSHPFPSLVTIDFPKYTGPPFVPGYPTLVPITPVERRLDCGCCKRKQVPLRLGWGTTIHRCQGMTIGEGEVNRYIVIKPGTKSFESRNPGALYVALSRAKSAGTNSQDPDFAWGPNVLLNEDRLTHKVNTPLTRARADEVKRITNMSQNTAELFSHLSTKEAFTSVLHSINERAMSNVEE